MTPTARLSTRDKRGAGPRRRSSDRARHHTGRLARIRKLAQVARSALGCCRLPSRGITVGDAAYGLTRHGLLPRTPTEVDYLKQHGTAAAAAWEQAKADSRETDVEDSRYAASRPWDRRDPRNQNLRQEIRISRHRHPHHRICKTGVRREKTEGKTTKVSKSIISAPVSTPALGSQPAAYPVRPVKMAHVPPVLDSNLLGQRWEALSSHPVKIQPDKGPPPRDRQQTAASGKEADAGQGPAEQEEEEEEEEEPCLARRNTRDTRRQGRIFDAKISWQEIELAAHAETEEAPIPSHDSMPQAAHAQRGPRLSHGHSINPQSRLPRPRGDRKAPQQRNKRRGLSVMPNIDEVVPVETQSQQDTSHYPCLDGPQMGSSSSTQHAQRRNRLEGHGGT